MVVCERSGRHYALGVVATSAVVAVHDARAQGHHPQIAYPAETARDEVNRLIRALRTGPTQCPACDYPLQGLRGRTDGLIECPECGCCYNRRRTPETTRPEIPPVVVRSRARNVLIVVGLGFVLIVTCALIIVLPSL